MKDKDHFNVNKKKTTQPGDVGDTQAYPVFTMSSVKLANATKSV